MKFNVRTMTCGHCVRTVTHALQAIDSGARVQVDLAAGTVDAEGAFDAAAVIKALARQGYTATLAGAGQPEATDAACCGACHA